MFSKNYLQIICEIGLHWWSDRRHNCELAQQEISRCSKAWNWGLSSSPFLLYPHLQHPHHHDYHHHHHHLQYQPGGSKCPPVREQSRRHWILQGLRLQGGEGLPGGNHHDLGDHDLWRLLLNNSDDQKIEWPRLPQGWGCLDINNNVNFPICISCNDHKTGSWLYLTLFYACFKNSWFFLLTLNW